MAPRRGTSVTINSNANLESFYEQTLSYLHEKYHSHPTMLNYGEVSAEEKSAQSFHDAHGRATARNAMSNLPAGFNVGKDVA